MAKRKPGRKPKRKPYFGMDVQDAIVRYNALDADKNQSERNKIYRDEIHKAFDKLGENIINTFKFSYFDYGFVDIQNEVVAFMVMNMHKYDHTKGSKAFSYFSVVAKNYLILHNNANYKRYCTHSDVTALRNNPTHDGDKQQYYIDFTIEIIDYFEKNVYKFFKSKKDIDVAYAIIELLKKRDEIENFNKKALYVLIREMTNIETSYITKVVNRFKKEYRYLVNEFSSKGTIPGYKQPNNFWINKL